MSGWFDTTGLASFAKTALKEAQKQIDKALDIKDNPAIEGADNEAANAEQAAGVKTKESTASIDAAQNAANWGSFTGSFFENPNAHEMITTAPKAVGSISEEVIGSQPSPVKSVSDSLACVEPVSSSLSAENKQLSSSCILPESIVIVEEPYEQDEDTVSMKTVLECALEEETQQGNDEIAFETAASDAVDHSKSNQMILSLDEVPSEAPTIDTDSTHSFEHIQADGKDKDSTGSISTIDKMDILQVPSSQNSSPQTVSNDDIETTTSSDIEIISNPNGDSSSTNSATRPSPLKHKKSICSNQTASVMLNSSSLASAEGIGVPSCSSVGIKKGHCREPSEISILSESESTQSELDKLIQKVAELSETLEARETHLLQSEKENARLQQRCSELEQAFDVAKLTHLEATTQFEKKFQASLRERDAMRTQIKSFKEQLDNKVVNDNLSQLVADNNLVIDELKLEGEKLSKEILQQSNIIKKLRTKEKTSDAQLKRNKEQIASMQDEMERLKKSFAAKEEVERTQIEAVNKMSAEKRKLEEDKSKYQSTNEDLESKLKTLQASFDAAKAELQQRIATHSDLTRSVEEVQAVQKDKDAALAENQELRLQLKMQMERLRNLEQNMAQNEGQLREQNRELMSRLENAEHRAEMSTQEISLSTIPLMRQLEALQQQLTQRTQSWNKNEKALLDKLEFSQNRLKTLESVEATYNSKIEILQSRCIALEEKLSNALMQEEQAKIARHQVEMQASMKETNAARELKELLEQHDGCKLQIQQLQGNNQRLENELKLLQENQLAVSKSMTENLLEQRELRAELMGSHHQQQQHSPPTSCGVNSLEEAMGSNIDWHEDDFDTVSNSGRQGNASFLYGLTSRSFMGMPGITHNTTTLEHLQALLKQRDGELSNIQWEVSRLNSERDMLNKEISELTLEIENHKEQLKTLEDIEKNHADLQMRYDALLQMYGEKVERTEELELDLLECKEAYKTQIDELLAQPTYNSKLKP